MRKSDSELVNDWRAELLASGLKKRDVDSRYYDVMAFLRYLDSCGESFSTLSEELCWEYQGYLLEKKHFRTGEKLAHATVEAALYRLSAFLDAMVKAGFVPTNPLRAVDFVKAGRNPPIGLLREEELSLFLASLMDWEGETDLRNRMWAYRVHVMAETQYATGLRMSELGNLVPGDLDLDRLEVRVRCGKGGKDRLAYLTIYTASLLREYLALRHLVVKGGAKRNRYLFGPAGESLARAYNKRLNAVSLRLGYGRFYNHKFRHELGYHLLRAGCPIRSIQGILGHEKLSSTEVYTKVDAEDVRDILDSCHPRAS